MTRDDIIRIAREAGYGDAMSDLHAPALERFAALVAAAEREKVAAWMVERSYATGHGDTTENLLKELEWQVRESEREACAQMCDGLAARYPIGQRETACAAAIRARGQQ